MNLKQVLTSFVKAIVEEAQENPRFRARLEAIFEGSHLSERMPKKVNDRFEAQKGGRRTPAVLDPVDLARFDLQGLRSRLEQLDLDRLLDVVAQYGMDPGKLVMKWKSRERVIERIMEVAESRATKGDAFRGD